MDFKQGVGAFASRQPSLGAANKMPKLLLERLHSSEVKGMVLEYTLRVRLIVCAWC